MALKRPTIKMVPHIDLTAARNSPLWIRWHQTLPFLFIFIFTALGCDVDLAQNQGHKSFPPAASVKNHLDGG